MCVKTLMRMSYSYLHKSCAYSPPLNHDRNYDYDGISFSDYVLMLKTGLTDVIEVVNQMIMSS